MLLNAVIIILRELVEASLVISIFLAFSQRFNITRHWLFVGLIIGVSSAIFYAININTISQWLDGVGQEVVNAGIHLLIYVVLLLFVIFSLHIKKERVEKFVIFLMFIGVALASIREGSEIILYINGFFRDPALLKPVLFGSLIGAGIGISLGIIFYYSLVGLSNNIGAAMGFLLCLLVAGGMVLQATQLLSQADWITSQYPLWNTSIWISESSLMGQLLYALVGYESTPTLTQVLTYISAVGSMIVLTYLSKIYALRTLK
ncbi:FTR1 family protein [Pseudomonadota bacterium]|nr:FTR1 family protein [Pseudomonadota bacterium]